MSNDTVIYQTKPIQETFFIDGVKVGIEYESISGKGFIDLDFLDDHLSIFAHEINLEISKCESIIKLLNFAKQKLNERKSQ